MRCLILRFISTWLIVGFNPQWSQATPHTFAPEAIINITSGHEEKYHFLTGPWEVFLYQGEENTLAHDSPSIPSLDQKNWSYPKIIELPTTFRKLTGNRGSGNLILRSRLQFSQHMEGMELQIPTALSAIRVWANEKLIYEQGKIAYGKNYEKAVRTYGSVPLPAAQAIDLVLQISNYHHRNGGLRTPLAVGSRATILKADRRMLIATAFVTGSLFIVAFYHLALFTFRREEHAQLFLALICLGIAIRSLHAGNPRIAFELFGPLDFIRSFRIEYFTFVGSVVAFNWYYAFTFPGRLPTWVRWGSTAVCVTYMMIICVTDVIVFSGLLPYFQIFIIFLMSYGLILLGQALRNRDPGAISFSIGIAIFLLCALTEVILLLHAISYPVAFIGAYLLVLTHSISMARQFTRKFNELSYFEKQTRHAYQQIQKVFYPHQLQMMQQGMPMESTMPVGTEEGVVICFDIISSSSLPLHKSLRKEFFRVLFERCYQAMHENYQIDPLSSYAFRIKEMGDGFLCSVGFPFRNPTSFNNETLAVFLSLKFVEILAQIQKEKGIHPPVFCSIGIATGELEGFFPESGIKDYELLGKPLILATRYEKARYQVFEHSKPQSIVILQKAVYEYLGQELRRQFFEFDLTEANFRIRDDADAQTFYYCLADEWTSLDWEKVS
ncbi:MAG: 7TM diverse intracellular signaling domain-containing protein [Oligoflexus sp.]